MIFIENFSVAQKEIQYAVFVQKGIIIPHHKSFNYIIKDYINSYDFTLSFRSDGTKKWHSAYNFPRTGFGAEYTDFMNPDVLGKAFSLYSFADFAVIRKKSYELSLHCAGGLAYLNKPLSPENNRYNIIIGSRFNAYLHLYLTQKNRIFRNHLLQTGFGITHFSNGATKKPNLGINLGTIHAAYIFESKTKKTPREKPDFDKNPDFSGKITLMFGTGFRYFYPPWDKLYNNSSLAVFFEKRVNFYFLLSAGAELFYDKCLIKSMPLDKSYSESDFLFAGIFAGGEILFGRFSFGLLEGWHPRTVTEMYAKSYEKWSIRYRLNKNFSVGIALKATLGTAQFVEYRVGYTF